jgi:hypothetical protein
LSTSLTDISVSGIVKVDILAILNA